MSDEDPQAGDKVTIGLLRAIKSLSRRLRIIAGPGVRVRWTRDGQVVSVSAGTPPFAHPWKHSFSGREISFRRGTLNVTIEPTINGVPISGDPANGIPVPSLKIDFSMVNAENKSYVVVDPEFDGAGKPIRASIVQVATFDLFGPRWPLVVLWIAPDQSVQVFQHSFFNLRHWSKARGQNVRHFYSAQP